MWANWPEKDLPIRRFPPLPAAWRRLPPDFFGVFIFSGEVRKGAKASGGGWPQACNRPEKGRPVARLGMGL
jgi:hypothetical protein